ncbi:MAG TPA: VOC family protein [Gaiellaceae bacterium]|nr:VOC family protein [Gaiellaceae bacterium]
MPHAITPYLLYEDGAAACEFLVRAFGFEEALRSHSPEGRVWHAELHLGDGVVYLGEPGGGYVSPRRAGGTTVSIYALVDDLDAHFERARAEGAEIVAEPAEQAYGDRRYHAKDPEGHEWFFAQHLRDVPPEEWGAEVA